MPGSGKTFVLAQRVIRPAARRTDPAKILCLTFTKAAAANMAKTVFDTLAKWTALDDGELDLAIRAMSNAAAGRGLAARWRARLFALRAGDAGGLKVQTIHAFCTRLLQQFPFEANVAARFPRARRRDAERASQPDQSRRAARSRRQARQRASAGRLRTADRRRQRSVVPRRRHEAIGKRDAVTAWTERTGSVAAAIGELCGTLAIESNDTIERVEAEMVDGPYCPFEIGPRAARVFRTGLKTDYDQAARPRSGSPPRPSPDEAGPISIFGFF